MTCCICGNDTWLDLDGLRDAEYWIKQDLLPLDAKVGFQACKKCGFLTYAHRQTEDELKAFYRDSYRSVVQAANHITCARKNEYHKQYLAGRAGGPEWFQSVGLPTPTWPMNSVPDGAREAYRVKPKSGGCPRILDFGCAQGSFLAMMHDDFGVYRDHLDGTEWARGYREFGRVMFGLNITEDPIEDGRKYDLIVMYHTLEHVYDPVATLKKLKGMLTERGQLYISHPVWLGRLEEASGPDCRDFENLFHLNHCNVFTKQSALNCLAAAGLAMNHLNTSIYGMTYMAQPTDSPDALVPENASAVAASVEQCKKAIAAYVGGNPHEAITIWPEFPDAHVGCAYHKEAFRDEATQVRVLDAALKLMPGHSKLHRQRAMCELAWSETEADPNDPKKYGNRVKRFEKMMWEGHELKAGVEEFWHFMANLEYTYKRDAGTARKYWLKALEISPKRWSEIWTYIGHSITGIGLPVSKPASQMPELPEPQSKVTMAAIPKLAGMRAAMGFEGR